MKVAAVGSQSSGKSSTLEAYTGHPLFPRGDDIVTRCPIILQTEYDASADQETAFFNGEPTTLESLAAKIQRVTDSIPHGTVDETPITIRIVSKYLVTTSLVDLPGLTKVHCDGQDPSIVEKIRTMAKHYIADDDCIILAVTPATSDVANSDALALAKEVDPDKKRTLGVLTKVDAMEPGKNAASVLCGARYPLDLGWVGIVNRSQSDADDGMTILESQKKEEEFFASQECYNVLNGKWGSKYLAKRIQEIHENSIRVCMPEIKLRIENLLDKAENDLKRFDAFDDRDTTEMKLGAITKGLIAFEKNFQVYIRGDWRFEGSDTCRMVRIKESILRKELVASIASIDIDENLDLLKIQRVMLKHDPVPYTLNLTNGTRSQVAQQAEGLDVNLYAPNKAFHNLVSVWVLSCVLPGRSPSGITIAKLQPSMRMVDADAIALAAAADRARGA